MHNSVDNHCKYASIKSARFQFNHPADYVLPNLVLVMAGFRHDLFVTVAVNARCNETLWSLAMETLCFLQRRDATYHSLLCQGRDSGRPTSRLQEVDLGAVSLCKTLRKVPHCAGRYSQREGNIEAGLMYIPASCAVFC